MLCKMFWYCLLKHRVGVETRKKKTVGLPIHKRKLFARNTDMIFEQDFATPHSTSVNQQFMEEHFHAPTLWRFQDVDPLFFGAKWDDFWSIEREWAILSQRVYRNPRPNHIKAVMRRLREAVVSTEPATLTRLVHELPAKMNEIFRQKGKKIPSDFKPSKSKFACKCNICISSVFETESNFYQPFVNILKNQYIFCQKSQIFNILFWDFLKHMLV